MQMVIKLLLIAGVAVVIAQTKSMVAWCFIAVPTATPLGGPLIYLIWRLEPSGG